MAKNKRFAKVRNMSIEDMDARIEDVDARIVALRAELASQKAVFADAARSAVTVADRAMREVRMLADADRVMRRHAGRSHLVNYVRDKVVAKAARTTRKAARLEAAIDKIEWAISDLVDQREALVEARTEVPFEIRTIDAAE